LNEDSEHDEDPEDKVMPVDDKDALVFDVLLDNL